MVGGLNYVHSCSVSAWSGCKFNIFVLEWLVGWLAGWLVGCTLDDCDKDSACL